MRYRSRFAFGTTALALAMGLIVGIAMLVADLHKPERALYLAGGSGLLLAGFLAKNQQRRASWLLAGSATFVVLFTGIHEALPQYSRRFSLRHPVRMQVPLAEAHDAAIFCYPHRWDSVSFYANRGDVAAFSRDRRNDLVDALESHPRSLLFVQTKYMHELLQELPPSLVFIPRENNGNVTIGEVRRQPEAPPTLARK